MVNFGIGLFAFVIVSVVGVLIAKYNLGVPFLLFTAAFCLIVLSYGFGWIIRSLWDNR